MSSNQSDSRLNSADSSSFASLIPSRRVSQATDREEVDEMNINWLKLFTRILIIILLVVVIALIVLGFFGSSEFFYLAVILSISLVLLLICTCLNIFDSCTNKFCLSRSREVTRTSDLPRV